MEAHNRIHDQISWLFALILFFSVTTPLLAFNNGDRVQATATLNIHNSPILNSTVLGQANQGDKGTISGASSYDVASGFTFYYVIWDAHPAGYSASTYLQLVSSSPPPNNASAPTILSPGSLSPSGPLLTTLTPTFTWNAATGATGYGLYISKYPYGAANIIYQNTSLSGTSFTLPIGVLQYGVQYRWGMTSFTGSSESSQSTPLYFQTFSFGTVLGSFNNVEAYSNGSVDYDSKQFNTATGINTGLEWQCVEYVNRYYYIVYGMNLKSTSMYGNADHYFPNASAAGLTSYSNGNSNSPQIGDILCFSGGGYGHVAIIRNVGTNQVTVIQQNVSENTNDANYSYPMTVSNGTYTIDGSRLGSTYNCQGWLRKSSSPPPNNASAPTILSPGSQSPPGPLLTTLTPTFTWNAATGATGYGLYISKYPYGYANIIYQNTSLSGTSFTLPSGVLQNGVQYRWGMTSFTGSSESSQSTQLYFQTSPPPNNASAPIIDSLNPPSYVSSGSYESMTIYGSNFQNNCSLMFTFPDKTLNPSARSVTFVSNNQLSYQFNNKNDVGTWAVQVKNPDGQTSNKYSFVVIPDTSASKVVLGIDVSNKQGIIDWNQVKAKGISFAYAKATGGTDWVDASFQNNMINGKNAGIIMGAYHFAYPTYYTPDEEVQHFLAIAAPYIKQGYLPPTLDIEDDPGDGTYSSFPLRTLKGDSLSSWIQRWITLMILKTGITPVLYMNLNYAESVQSYLTKYNLWIASPGTTPTEVPNTGVWNSYRIKQYDWYASMPGISTNVCLDAFNGDINSFTNFINNATPINYISTDNFKFINYPNPFGSNTIIAYRLPIPTLVTITIFDELGRVIQTLMNGNEDAGYYTINFDASSLPGGLYFCRIEAGSYNKTIKLIHIK